MVTGKIYINDTSGTRELTGQSHDTFMGMISKMQAGEYILIVTGGHHHAYNSTNILSIEWETDK